jgi:hypothetical protein
MPTLSWVTPSYVLRVRVHLGYYDDNVDTHYAEPVILYDYLENITDPQYESEFEKFREDCLLLIKKHNEWFPIELLNSGTGERTATILRTINLGYYTLERQRFAPLEPGDPGPSQYELAARNKEKYDLPCWNYEKSQVTYSLEENPTDFMVSNQLGPVWKTELNGIPTSPIISISLNQAVIPFYDRMDAWKYYAFIGNTFHEASFLENELRQGLSADQLAANNLHRSLQNRTEAQLGVFLAEIDDSLRLLVKSVLTVASVIRQLRRGNISGAIQAIVDHLGSSVTRNFDTRSLRQRNNHNRKQGRPLETAADYASNGWLELQFGWKPLLQDIQDFISIIKKFLNDDLNPKGALLSFHGYGDPFKDNRKALVLEPFHLQGNESFTKFWVQGNIGHRVAYHMRYRVASEMFDIQTLLGVEDLGSVVWELVPFSFVVDWFLPIGDWLESLADDKGLALTQYVHSVKNHGEAQLFIYDPSNPTYNPEPSVTNAHWAPKVIWNSFTRFAIFNNDSGYADGDLHPAYKIPPFVPPVMFTKVFKDPWKLTTAAALIKSVSR